MIIYNSRSVKCQSRFERTNINRSKHNGHKVSYLYNHAAWQSKPHTLLVYFVKIGVKNVYKLDDKNKKHLNIWNTYALSYAVLSKVHTKVHIYYALSYAVSTKVHTKVHRINALSYAVLQKCIQIMQFQQFLCTFTKSTYESA